MDYDNTADKDIPPSDPAAEVLPQAKHTTVVSPGDLPDAAHQHQQGLSTSAMTEAGAQTQAHAHIDRVQEQIEHGLPESEHVPLRPEETPQGSSSHEQTSAPTDVDDGVDMSGHPFQGGDHFADEQDLEVDVCDIRSSIFCDCHVEQQLMMVSHIRNSRVTLRLAVIRSYTLHVDHPARRLSWMSKDTDSCAQTKHHYLSE